MAFMPRSASASYASRGSGLGVLSACVFRLSAQARVQTRWHKSSGHQSWDLALVARVGCKPRRNSGRVGALRCTALWLLSPLDASNALRAEAELAACKDTSKAGAAGASSLRFNAPSRSV